MTPPPAGARSDSRPDSRPLPEAGRGAESARQIAAADEIGARTGAPKLVFGIAFCWSLFQLFAVSEIPFWLSHATGINLVLNSGEIRIWHLSFALALATLAYPLRKSAPRDRIPIYDWALLLAGLASCFYLLWFKNDIADRAGLPTAGDLAASAIGLFALAVAVFRALGLPMLFVAGFFVLYVFFGHLDFLPEVAQWKGASAGKALWHYWMQTEGVFGVALGVSAAVIFLFVLFGALLERAGAGNYFVTLAFALLGHLRGGPAKAAVAASAMSGLYSGSSIANVVTTGSFTIPLMRRTGFTPEKAGAVEVASSTNGQLTPPVMGAAAFLITEFVGVSYTDVIRHAILPALVSYIALLYIVHLEALKLGLRGLRKPPPLHSRARRIAGFLGGFLGIGLACFLLRAALAGVKAESSGGAAAVVGALFFVGAHLALVRVAAKRPDLPARGIVDEMEILPRAGAVAATGLYFFPPVAVLLWCVLVERLSPGLAAFWAVLAILFVVVTQHPLKAFFRGEREYGAAFRRGLRECARGLAGGGRNMVAIGVATGIAGVIVGSVSLTGAHQIVGEFVEFLSGGNLLLMLLLVAVMSLILGLGLPTTANYIVVSSLMAGVIVELGAQHGLILPLIAVHLFVFYFGILADDTPPVGLAAFAASAISGGDPIKTGLQGFAYDIRTALLPFLFLFNTELLLIDVGWGRAIFVFAVATGAMLLFAAATQNYFLVRNKWWEGVLLLLVALTLFRPGFWLDRAWPPFVEIAPSQIHETAARIEDGGHIRLRARGERIGGGIKTKTALLPMGEAAPDGEESGARRLEEQAGFAVRIEEDGRVYVDSLAFGGAAEKAGFDFDWEILTIEADNENRPPKEVFYPPALLVLAFVVWSQWRRRARRQ